MAACNLTAETVRRLLDYNPTTGVFVWIRRPLSMFNDLRSCEAWNGKYAGKSAGGISNGYRSIRIDGRTYWAHRLAWLYIHGAWPSRVVDHINGDPLDNAITNLRNVSRRVNQQNFRRRPANTKPLPLGVHFLSRKVTKRFSASIRIAGRSTHLGYFSTAEDAHAAYVAAKRLHHEGCTI